MNENRSVATIDDPEFIDVHPYNPLISECQIKVLYLGQNRNGSYIDKNTAIQMANSLPMCPIVGRFNKETDDFGGHGNIITIEDGEVKFSVDTKPYGFIAPDARVWFQKFVDTDAFGNEVEREYMMTTGYLWTGQYEEAKKVIEEGKGQSMELDSDTLDGSWANDSKTGMDFFIINDALFSKLCILGDDVEPCFEGASISAVEKQFSQRNAEFTHSLYTMMQELKDALGEREGGSYMPKPNEHEDELQEQVPVEEPAANEEPVEMTAETQSEPEPAVEEEPELEDAVAGNVVEDEPVSEVTDEFSKKDETPSDDKSDDTSDEDTSDDDATDDDDTDDDDNVSDEDDDKKKPATKHTVENDDKLADIMSELAELREFKHHVESAEKDKVINKYHMLSDEDKADVIAHKDEYTLEQIDEKLALVYVNKNVDFSTVDGLPETNEKIDEQPLLAFSLDDANISNTEPVDAVQEALRSLC